MAGLNLPYYYSKARKQMIKASEDTRIKAGARPYESMRIQISKVSEIADIGPKFSEAVSVNHLLSLILKQALDLMAADVCIIWLKDNAGNIIPRISFGLKTRLIQSLKIRLKSKTAKRIVEGAGPVNIPDLARDDDVPIKRFIKKEGLRSLLAVPLIVGGERIGALMVCTKALRRFTGLDLKIFDALARESALAIANIGLYDKMDKRLKEKTKEMSMLFTMSRSLTSSIDLDMLLNLILEKTRALMKAKVCALWLLDRSRRKIAVASAAPADKNSVKKFSRYEPGLSEKVMKAGESVIINDNAGSILAVPLFSNKRRAGMLAVYVQERRAFGKEDIEMLEMVASLCSMAIDNATMLERIKKDYLNTIKTLAKIIDANDSYTKGHCYKVMRYSLEICKRLKLPGRDLNAVKTASLLHDIGKVGIDLGIIRKPGRLTEDDWQKVRMHPEIGARILAQVGFLNEVVPLVRYHHQRYGGGGYPDANKRGQNIPIGARVLAVADAFDAMTSDRPYRKAMSKERAMNELKRCSGSQFDPKIVDAFMRRAK